MERHACEHWPPPDSHRRRGSLHRARVAEADRAFGGHGIEGTATFMESVGLRPGRTAALVAGLAEVIGGLLFGLGFLAPVGAVLISAVMMEAIARVYGPKGLWGQNGGYEYLLVTVILT